MSSTNPRLRRAAAKLRALPTREERALERWVNGTAIDADIDFILTADQLADATNLLVAISMPFRRVKAEGHPFPAPSTPASMFGQLLSFAATEEPPRALVDRIRDNQAGIATDNEEWVKRHLQLIVGRRVVGADDGLPLRESMARGDHGPAATADIPPPGAGPLLCPLDCGRKADPSQCLCSGTASDLARDRQQVSQQRVSPRRPGAPTDNVAVPNSDPARTGQPRPNGQAPEKVPECPPVADSPAVTEVGPTPTSRPRRRTRGSWQQTFNTAHHRLDNRRF